MDALWLIRGEGLDEIEATNFDLTLFRDVDVFRSQVEMHGFRVTMQEVQTLHQLQDKAFEINLRWDLVSLCDIHGQGCKVVFDLLADEGDHVLVFKRCLYEIEHARMPELG